ncbi:hypothetical protein E1264_01565 [Actinomadura sp. KC216]|uniref:hypothetical protein n=1 Tax=Actinomadura sp. KC216 TaxID=2530370 RepID=UPI00104A57FA|nr:hypothetical protein [Actinomadura sp. KC216]TDB91504.1 hypothetical protein E1264_01565 [Actinomadura sp. KC216]
MNVLFLALGGTRRPAITAEAEHVIAHGDKVTVLVGTAAKWRKGPLPEGVDLVELSRLEHGSRPAIVRLLLTRVPLFLLRVCLPGPLRGLSKRLRSAYVRRVERPVDRRLARLYRRDPARARERVIDRDLLRGRSIDLVIVGDPESMVVAAGLRDVIARSGARLAYTGTQERPLAGHVEG